MEPHSGDGWDLAYQFVGVTCVIMFNFSSIGQLHRKKKKYFQIVRSLLWAHFAMYHKLMENPGYSVQNSSAGKDEILHYGF